MLRPQLWCACLRVSVSEPAKSGPVQHSSVSKLMHSQNRNRSTRGERNLYHLPSVDFSLYQRGLNNPKEDGKLRTLQESYGETDDIFHSPTCSPLVLRVQGFETIRYHGISCFERKWILLHKLECFIGTSTTEKNRMTTRKK